MTPQTADLIRSIQVALERVEMDEATQWRPDDLREREQDEATETKPAAPEMSVSPMRDGVKR